MSDIALNLDYLNDQYQKVGSPIFTFEGGKCHDIIKHFIKSSKKIVRHKKKDEESFFSFPMISKQKLYYDDLGPKKKVKFTNSLKKCDLNFDPDQEKLHECSKYVYRITGCTDRGSSFHLRKDI